MFSFNVRNPVNARNHRCLSGVLMNRFPSIAFIGGGNMANALVSGLLGQGCALQGVLKLTDGFAAVLIFTFNGE